ncbi:MAG: hypothetical protein GWP05_06065, partial [Anaerolineaceae bacterium]|nr:hypothetical protein [Anaerolineaceae bacterium]
GKENSSRDLPPVRLPNPTAESFVASLKVVHFFAVVFFWLVMVALMLHLAVFVVFQSGLFDESLHLSSPAEVAAPGDEAANGRPAGEDKVAAAESQAGQAGESDQPSWWNRRRSDDYLRYVQQLMATFRLIGLMSSLLLLVTLFLYLEIALLGRLAGVKSLTVSFFLILLFVATVYSWEPLLPGGQIIGSLFKLDDFSDSLTLLTRQVDTPAWADRSFYYHYGRFMVEPLLSLVLLVAAWLQFRRGYEHTVLLNE